MGNGEAQIEHKKCSFVANRYRRWLDVNDGRYVKGCSVEIIRALRKIDADIVLQQDGNNEYLCALHIDVPSNRLDYDLIVDEKSKLIEGLIHYSRTSKVLDLVGIITDRELEITSAGLFGLELPASWLNANEKSLLMGQSQIYGNVEISDLTQCTCIDLQNSIIKGNLVVLRSSVKTLDLSGIQVDGDVHIVGCEFTEALIFRHGKIAGNVIIEPSEDSPSIIQKLDFEGAEVKCSVSVLETKIGCASQKLEGQIILDDSSLATITHVGSLRIENLNVFGEFYLGGLKASGPVSIMNTKIEGHIHCEVSNAPSNLHIEDMSIVPNILVENRDPNQEALQYRKELFALRKAVQRNGDIDAYVNILRLSRGIEINLRTAPLYRRIVWFLHEQSSDSGGSWATPLAWLSAAGVLFTAIYCLLYSLSGSDLEFHVITTTTITNTFTPFLITQTPFLETMPPAVVVAALVHSIISTGIIASLLIAVKARQLPEE